jgi:uncharacterized protein YndB with AHSA1/START domain
MSKLTLSTEGDRHIIITRRFAAGPKTVYRAHTEPNIIRQWLFGPDGWSMTGCDLENRVGGKMRYEWTHTDGRSFYLTGELVALEPYARIVHIERMHLPDPTPDNHVETKFEPDGAGTLMTMRMTVPTAAVRAAMLKTGMEHGMEASYARLDGAVAAEVVAG